MKKYTVLLAILALVFASLACQAVTGGVDTVTVPEPPANSDDNSEPLQPAEPPAEAEEEDNDDGDGDGSESEFPIPDDAFNVVDVAGVMNFQVKMPLDEAMKFYMDAFTKSGYTERAILTVTSDITFNMVYDGHPSGKAIVVQGVDMGDGSVNINISLQEI